jgi:hypothetical protein
MGIPHELLPQYYSSRGISELQAFLIVREERRKEEELQAKAAANLRKK